MLDIKFVKDNPEAVKENIKKKFKDHLLPLVDQAIQLYDDRCEASRRADDLRANRNEEEFGLVLVNNRSVFFILEFFCKTFNVL